MAKVKARAERNGKPRGYIIGLRGTTEYKQWAAGLADHCGVSLSEAVTLGLAELAKSRGYEAAIPER